LAISPFISAAGKQLKWYFHFRVCTCCSKGSEWMDVGGLRPRRGFILAEKRKTLRPRFSFVVSRSVVAATATKDPFLAEPPQKS